ncbi:MAG TPA: carbamoyltransferase C-terminal domain-containing protein [Candidatus Acidoferrales bacterium]|nr:carbamoyltransferase C-terminal domain-containing protein [Candidatus Acidoferrales bacterium]
MIVLGLNAYHGDAAAAILVDGELVAAVEEERFERVKHWAGFPKRAVEYCLSAANAKVEEIDHLAIGRNPRAHFVEKIIYSVRRRPQLGFVADRFRNMLKIRDPRSELATALGVDVDRIRAMTHAVEHHKAHVASSFFASPFDDAAIVSVDGFGDFASTTWGVGRGARIDSRRHISFPHSLGLFYSGITQYLGFPRFGDEYKVMGLAAYGQPDFRDDLRRVVIVHDDGGFALGLDYFQHHTKGIAMTWVGEPRYERINSDRLIKLLGSARQPGAPMDDRFRAIAASAQSVFEEAYFAVLKAAAHMNGGRLCLAGGCALNSLANGKVRERGLFEEIFIQPASYDAGTALGAALFVWHQVLGRPRRFHQTHSYFGPGFSQAEIDTLLRGEDVHFETLPDELLLPRVAAALRDGKIVGWFQGRMEWGPRALGNRSILADPRRADMKSILNEKIKLRETFRPFAPAILLERVGDYFEQSYPDPFMLKVYKVKEPKRREIPAVVHVDGTGRLQTVARSENRRFHDLIAEFDRLTGVPVLLNTSFNENEPIVCTPKEALDCFRRTQMDVLVLGNAYVEKPG